MDTVIIKTFLEVVACDSFVGAAERMFVSQSAVSLRVKSLEEQLGQKVFIRSKKGIQLTAAGRQFERYAQSFLQVWEEAKQQVAVPENYKDILVIAGEYDLWNRLLLRWLPTMAEAMPAIAFRAEVAHHYRLTRQIIEGTTDIAVMYTPQVRPGLMVEKLFEDLLVLVSTDPNTTQLDESYVYVDWGEEFFVFHSNTFPDKQHPRLSFTVAPIALTYLLNCGGSAYLPKRMVDPFLDKQRLFEVPKAPSFSFMVHVSWRNSSKQLLIKEAITYLKATAKKSLANELPPPFWY